MKTYIYSDLPIAPFPAHMMPYTPFELLVIRIEYEFSRIGWKLDETLYWGEGTSTTTHGIGHITWFTMAELKF